MHPKDVKIWVCLIHPDATVRKHDLAIGNRYSAFAFLLGGYEREAETCLICRIPLIIAHQGKASDTLLVSVDFELDVFQGSLLIALGYGPNFGRYIALYY